MSLPSGDAAQAWVLLQCHTLIVALPTVAVRRVLLEDEVRFSADQIRVGGVRYPAFDLGACLGLPPLHGAWVLLELAGAHASLIIGLRAGKCLQVVRRPPPTVALPAQLFTGHHRAIRAAFELSGTLGYELAIEHLLTPQQLLAAADPPPSPPKASEARA